MSTRQRIAGKWKLGLAILAACSVLVASIALYANFRHGSTARLAGSTGYGHAQTLREFAVVVNLLDFILTSLLSCL
jgi:hypothetical protein